MNKSINYIENNLKVNREIQTSQQINNTNTHNTENIVKLLTYYRQENKIFPLARFITLSKNEV